MSRWMLVPMVVSWVTAAVLNWHAFGPIGVAVYLVLMVGAWHLGWWVGERERGDDGRSGQGSRAGGADGTVWRGVTAHRLTRPESRSRVSETLHRIANLLIQVNSDEGASREEDASLLREISRLAMSAAQDLDPR